MTNFVTNRSLLNPKFEGYKLSPLAQDDHVSRFPLTAHPTQANVSGRLRTPLSFEEVQSRITHDHLAISHDSRSVDDDFNVIRVVFNPDLTPTFSTFSGLPKPIQTNNTEEGRHKEHTSAVSLEGRWLVSDGNSSSSEEPKETKEKNGKASVSYFDVLLVEVPIETKSDEPQALKVVWKARGEDVPVYIGYNDSRSAFFILGKSIYKGVSVVTPPAYEPSSDELTPIPRGGEVLPEGPVKPLPYSWSQTSDSVTTLSLLIKYDLPTSFQLPRYSLQQLWDSINPSSSLWTWDREADREFRLLTLYLDKQNDRTWWEQVFASAGRTASSERANSDPPDEEIPETLDPFELYAIREALEKYTSALQKCQDASGLGLGSGVPSLARASLTGAWIVPFAGRSKDVWAKQSLLKVGGGPSEALLGVGALRVDDKGGSEERFILLCLCENEMVIVKDLV
ncbi:hypothetical protein ACEPAH_9469 [Sanghuangporus vaninii]